MTPSCLSSCSFSRLVVGLTATLLSAVSLARGADTPADTAEIVHVLNRITFGPRPGDIDLVRKMGVEAFIQQQLHPETLDDSATEKEVGQLAILQMDPQQLASLYHDDKVVKKEQKKEKKALNAEQTDAVTTNAAPVSPSAPDAAMSPAPASAPEATDGQKHGKRNLAADGMAKNNEWKPSAAIEQLEQGKLVRAIDSQRQLQEVLADFWNNHFNVDVKKKVCSIYKVADDRDVIRGHLWGKFRDLLGASAKSPAMLYYLDNASSTVAKNSPQAGAGQPMMQEQTAVPPAKQKKKKDKGAGGINENYAREVMELHTLGVDGGYTQQDVQEVARCFTGWTIDRRTASSRFMPRNMTRAPRSC